MDFEKTILIVVLYLFLASSYRVSGARILTHEEDSLLEIQLKLINKPPVKSIQTEYGHIVDCIDINKQLAFDHPLLKHHKIQRTPSFLRGKTRNVDPSHFRPLMIGLAKDACPIGTVPIRRATKEDLVASKLLLNNFQPQAAPSFNNTYNAVIQMEKNKYYMGVEGSVTVYDPQVKEGQTYAQIYAFNGDDLDYYNLITTGWMVSPDIYHDGSPHFFAVFTNDNFEQAGCLNNMCPGFVQTHKSVYLGATITNVSVPSGPQFQTTISLQRDSNYNWWISIEGFVVGYYPKEIVFNLNQPQGIGWGGVAVGRPNGNSAPPMGSGEFSDGSNACEFSNIQYRNEENTTLAPQSPHYKIITDNPKCYDLKYDGYKNPEVGFTFKFGGPGGPCSN
nr:uncharacterized protein LOC111989259 [Quercus suber]